MSDFVGYDATQNDGDLELGVVTPCEMRHIVVVDTGKDRDNCKTKGSVLEPILGGLGEYAKRDVGSFERLPTGILRVSGGMSCGAV
jgi:hypothetical protein